MYFNLFEWNKIIDQVLISVLNTHLYLNNFLKKQK